MRETLFDDLIARCRSHFLVKLHKHLDFVAIEQACVAYRHNSGPGRYETYPVSVLVRCLLVMYLEMLSYREMEMRLYSDMLVRWFCGLSFGDEIPDHTTLERFEQWVKQHQPRIYQDTVLKQIDEEFPASKKLPQVADTYAMLANAAEEDLVTRLRHTARCLLAETNQAAEFPADILSGFDGNSLFGVQAEQSVYCWIRNSASNACRAWSWRLKTCASASASACKPAPARNILTYVCG